MLDKYGAIEDVYPFYIKLLLKNLENTTARRKFL